MTPALLDAPTALRACVFTVGDAAFALPVANVREVVVVDEWTTVPLAPPHVVGVANRRGEVMTIAEAPDVLGLPARPRGRRLRTLVVTDGGREVALVVDDVLGLERFDEIAPLSDGARRADGGRAVGLLRRGHRLVTLLAADRLVAALRGEGSR